MKLLVFVLLAYLPLCICLPLSASLPIQTNTTASVICEWKEAGKELLCDGKLFIFEAQDAVGSGRWWLDMLIVTVLIIFAGTTRSD